MTPSVGDFVSVVLVCKNKLKERKRISDFSGQEEIESLQRLVKGISASHYHTQLMLAEYL